MSYNVKNLTNSRLSNRSRLKLTPDEIDTLNKFISEDSAPYASIMKLAKEKGFKITRNTIVDSIKRGWATKEPAQALRAAMIGIKELQDSGEI